MTDWGKVNAENDAWMRRTQAPRSRRLLTLAIVLAFTVIVLAYRIFFDPR